MKFLKNKTFYLSALAITLFAVSGYYFATSISTTGTQQAAETVVETTSPALENTDSTVINATIPAASSTAETQNVSFEPRPMMIYVRRVNSPIVCGDPINAPDAPAQETTTE